MMRMALAQCLNHVTHRTVFQKKLIDQPMMRRVLADMALETEAATALVMRLGRAYDHALPGETADEAEAAWKRIMTPAIKYWVCKTGPGFAYEAMETLGGNGYVEDGLMGRIYREMPVNAIWEGSGNVMGLDVLRVFGRDADAARVTIAELAREADGLPGATEAADMVSRALADSDSEANARGAVEMLARLAAAAALKASAPREVAELFASTRLCGRRGATFGTGDLDATAASLLLGRVLPPL
jgi:putative acyl-CoA dehydrogenase